MHQQNMYVDSVRSNQLEKNKKLFKKDDAKSVEI
jgi:hypothetical protein